MRKLIQNQLQLTSYHDKKRLSGFIRTNYILPDVSGFTFIEKPLAGGFRNMLITKAISFYKKCIETQEGFISLLRNYFKFLLAKILVLDLICTM